MYIYIDMILHVYMTACVHVDTDMILHMYISVYVHVEDTMPCSAKPLDSACMKCRQGAFGSLRRHAA